MRDERVTKLAENLVNYSVRLKENENILIDLGGEDCYKLVQEIIKQVYKVKANPFIKLSNASINNTLFQGINEKMLEMMKKEELEQMKQMDAYIAIRASKNVANSVNIPMEKLMLYEKYMDDVLIERVDNTKWVVLRYPNDSMAQLAKMNTEEFEDFYFDVCTLDYSKMD